MDTNLKIGARLRVARKKKGLTQQALATSLGLSQNYLSAVESGKENLSKPVVLLLYNLYRINPAWLLSGTGPMFEEIAVADRIAELAASYGRNDVTEKILIMLKDMDEDGRRDVLKYVEKEKLLAELKRERKKEAG